jgi:hypothetical protein
MTIVKIIGTVLIAFYVIVCYIMGIAIASSSHNISMSSRENAIQNGNIAIIVGPITMVCIWLPWTKWLSKK